MASLTAIVVAAVALVVVLTQRGGGGAGDQAGAGGGEVFLQNTSASGPDPFTRSTARAEGASPAPPALPSASGADANARRGVSGATPGLYGGTHRIASCDVEQQIRFLADEPAKNAAFASVIGLKATEVPGYLRSLTPLQLRLDTRVTNHGFRGGSPVPYQAVLQAGTAVMVDDHGVPRVRCACGNPLTPPIAQKEPKQVGAAWPGYRTGNVVVVQPSVTVIKVFVIHDPRTDRWVARESGDTGHGDKHTTPPPPPSPSPSTSPPSSPPTSPSSPASPDSPVSPKAPVPCVSVTGGEPPAPVDGVTPPPCPSPPDSPTTPAPPDSPSTPADSDPGSASAPTTETSGPGPESQPASGLTSSGSSESDGPSVPGSPGQPLI